MTSLASLKGPSVTLAFPPENHARTHRERMEAIEREQHTGLLQGFVVLHHGRNGLGLRHGARRGLLIPLGNHQHHESHRSVSLWFRAWRWGPLQSRPAGPQALLNASNEGQQDRQAPRSFLRLFCKYHRACELQGFRAVDLAAFPVDGLWPAGFRTDRGPVRRPGKCPRTGKASRTGDETAGNSQAIARSRQLPGFALHVLGGHGNPSTRTPSRASRARWGVAKSLAP